MKKILLFLLSVLFLIADFSYSQYSSPESVTYDTTGHRYFISNTTSQKIVQRDRQGVVTDFVTVGSGIHGVTVHNGRVYVCNQTRIKGYDLTTAAEVFNVTISGSTFLNDLAVDNSGIIYVTDFSARRIYKLNTNTSEFWIYVSNTTNQPNGIYIDTPRNRLLVCCWGANAPIKSVNLSDSSISNIITTSYNNCDGISLDRNENVYISTWGIQSVVKYDINFANSPVIAASSLSNPADIYVNKLTDTLAVPNAGNSTVTFYFLNTPVGVNQNSSSILNTFELFQNYPNPFNPVTVIRYTLTENQFTSLKVFDIRGKEVDALVNEKQNPGFYEVTFNASRLSSGMYYYKLTSGNSSIVRKLTLIK